VRGFSWKHGITRCPSLGPDLITSRPKNQCLSLSGPAGSTYGLERVTMYRVELPFSVPAHILATLGGAGMLTCFPSPTPRGLGLGID
jgi:hypothetical protein